MPRYDVRQAAPQEVSPEMQRVLALVVAELNALRAHVGLPPRTVEELQAGLWPCAPAPPVVQEEVPCS